ncbi:hypothetical protein Tco_1433427, partial [Tanacetum coccineum]
AFKQAKGGETYVATLSWKDFRDIFFLQYFPRLAGFVGKKAGPPEEQAKHFKWALCDCTLDGIVNTKFTDVANAARNIEILRERVATVIRSHGRTKVSSTTVLLGLQVRKDTRTMPPLLHATHVGNFIWVRHVIGLLKLVLLVVRLGIWPGIALRMVETVVREMGTTINLLLRGEYFLRPRIRQLTLQVPFQELSS